MNISKLSEATALLTSEEDVEITLTVDAATARWLLSHSCPPHFIPEQLIQHLLENVRDGNAEDLASYKGRA